MRLLIIDKTAGLAASHERHTAIAAQAGIELHVAGPRTWFEAGRTVHWQPGKDLPYAAHVCHIAAQGYYARAFYLWGLRSAIRRAKPDAIQLLEEPWALSTWQAARLAGSTPLLFYTWENIYRDFEYPSRLSSLYARIDRRLHRQAVGAVCATQGAEEVLRRKGFQPPTAVIPYGIPEFFFASPKASTQVQEPFTIGFIGRFLSMKGVGTFLRAAQRLLHTRVLMIGSGEGERIMRQLITALCLDHCVTILPPVPETEIPATLNQMDVLVLPSETTPGWQEQLGRVLIEAMACGVPVIGSDSGAIPETIGDAGLIFQQNDVEELTACLKRLREDESLRAELASKGRQRALERYTWKRFAESLVGFYREIGILEE